ncbi:MAG: hypothetical protein BHW17_08575 [Dorea sp. 42_8]|nr:MAG: hypothetical protein BHW17_08575 [Dorea sp. 42_8]
MYRHNTFKKELFIFMNMIAQNLYIYQYIQLTSFIRHVFICFPWFSFWIHARISGVEVNELINIDTVQMLEFICVLVE